MDNNKRNTTGMTPVADILRGYVRYWKWFVLSVGVCLLIGVTVVFITQKQYQSSLLILLNEDKNSGRSSAIDFDLEAFGSFPATNSIENEIAILSSPDMMRPVADVLNLQTTYYVVKKFRKIELYGRQSPLHVSMVSAGNQKNGSFRFYVQKNGTAYKIYGSYKDRKIQEKVHSLPVEIKLDDTTRVAIRQTGGDITDGEKYHVLINDIGATAESLAGSLSVSPVSKSSLVLELGFTGNHAEKGAAILTELVRQYNKMNVDTKNEVAYRTAILINDRLKEISAELGEAEENVVDFKQKNQIADLSAEALLFIQQTGQNEQKLMEVETQLNIISIIERFVGDPQNRYEIIPNIGISDIALAQIVSEYNNKLIDAEGLLKGMGEENPVRIRLTEDIDNMRNRITGSLKNVKQAYNVTKRALLGQAYSTKSKVLSVPQQERGLIEKVREQKIKENLFLFLMQKREEINLSVISTADKARIIASPQENAQLTAPKLPATILSALIFGFLFPLVFINTRNFLKAQVRDRNDLEKLSDVPVIGQITGNKTKDRVVVQKKQYAGIAEMFRSLRNNLYFVWERKTNKVILVTSTGTGEGKTFISINLAVSFALSGRKVLWVDGDIRNQTRKDYVKPGMNKGLSDYLTGEDQWMNYVNHSDLNDHLQVMASGTVPPYPNELLMNRRLKEFLEEAKKEYDFVIIDTASAGLVSDAYLLGAYSDLTLYIVRENSTPKNAVNFINIQKQENKLPNMYLVLNDSYPDSSYKYGYGKSYGFETK